MSAPRRPALGTFLGPVQTLSIWAYESSQFLPVIFVHAHMHTRTHTPHQKEGGCSREAKAERAGYRNPACQVSMVLGDVEGHRRCWRSGRGLRSVVGGKRVLGTPESPVDRVWGVTVLGGTDLTEQKGRGDI